MTCIVMANIVIVGDGVPQWKGRPAMCLDMCLDMCLAMCIDGLGLAGTMVLPADSHRSLRLYQQAY